MKQKLAFTVVLSVIAASLVSCAVYTAPTREETLQVVKSSFKERGIAKLDRLNQSELQVACSEASLTGKDLPKDVRDRLEKQALATVKFPADGQYLGDFKQGERIAQTGVGMQWSDSDTTVAGGNCYACHEIAPQEIAFGNIGPSLKGYRKLRGSSPAVMTYTWGKLWNSHAYNACSQMPRYGDANILTTAQLKDLMALLLDPNSPVNK
ncbi:MAG TPA: sulfur oxidation c-type cytochrome SoxX [Burkholderiaceae bacterium]|jgi:sulfur-oxidizing protein SoxX|nr:sulfur oxidation c-type cytochrome SoxX [Burkholderiaceae bacterium]